MARYTRTVATKQDLAEIWDYIANDNQTAADKVLRALDKSCALLATNPEMGRMRQELADELRSYPVANYVIFYQIRAEDILIVRILHGAREITRQFE